jgi:hypothetical protein
MRQADKHRRKQKAAEKKAAHEQMIKDANAKHDIQFGSNPELTKYYTEYIQGTGLRQSK